MAFVAKRQFPVDSRELGFDAVLLHQLLVENLKSSPLVAGCSVEHDGGLSVVDQSVDTPSADGLVAKFVEQSLCAFAKQEYCAPE